MSKELSRNTNRDYLLVEEESDDMNNQEPKVKKTEEVNQEKKKKIGSVECIAHNNCGVDNVTVELLAELVQKVKVNDDKSEGTKKSNILSNGSNDSAE